MGALRAAATGTYSIRVSGISPYRAAKEIKSIIVEAGKETAGVVITAEAPLAAGIKGNVGLPDGQTEDYRLMITGTVNLPVGQQGSYELKLVDIHHWLPLTPLPENSVYPGPILCLR
ncbi:MAG: hypothetical protein HQK83_14800 [Fibrobacteria bacterium]|nr:hypothetical protein [Fibrobacteria bacterium]